MKIPARLKFISAMGVVLVITLLASIELHWSRPIGSGPAGPKVSKQPFENPWSTQAVKLVGIGDSITAGLGAKSKDHSYFQRLIRNPVDEYSDMTGCCLSNVLPNLACQNLAISGSTSIQHLEVILEKLMPHPPEVYGLIVITTGGNDIIHNYGRSTPREGAMYGATLQQALPWIESFRIRLDRMLDRIVECFPGGCEIYVADIYDPTDGVGDAPSVYLPHWPDGLAIHSQYNQIIRQACKSRVCVFHVPLYENFLGHGSHCRQFWKSTYRSDDPHYWFFDNIEDPNDRGYDAIRRVFMNSILEHSRLKTYGDLRSEN